MSDQITLKSNYARKRGVFPGFGLSLGYTLTYLSLIVIIPLVILIAQPFSLGFEHFIQVVTSKRVVNSYLVSLGSALIAALINSVMGLMAAWVLVRYRFPGRKVLDAIVDLPFALPTAVAGIALTVLFGPSGWVGQALAQVGLVPVNTVAGIVIALIFIGFPFVVRTVQPVLAELEGELEEAAACLGARRAQIFFKVILPQLFPAMLTGFALAFARSIGEYGSVIFISGNLPNKTEITPLLIMFRFEEVDYEGAAAIATVLLIFSFIMLLLLNLLQWWQNRQSR